VTSLNAVDADPWPNLFVVGVERAGTTSLWRYLSAHPDVFMSRVKEPSFLLDDPRVAVPTEAEYLALFAGRTEPWRGEASPAYFYDAEVPGRIARVAPEARILAILRDPVERAYSAYWHYVKFRFERRSFRQAVEEELAGDYADREHDRRKDYLARSRYPEPLRRFGGVFGERLHVLFLEELRTDPPNELAAVYRFLEVDPSVADATEAGLHNEFSQPRNRIAAQLMTMQRARAVARAVLPEAMRGRADRLVLERRPKPPLDPDLRERLRAIFEEDRLPLTEMLARPLPW
jgi:sulfotransferase family protein